MRVHLCFLGLIAALAILPAALTAPAAATPAYVVQPDLEGNRIVFCAEGDLWLTSDQGGLSRRLTVHAGSESSPRFSPGGEWIAFTGEYDGNADVYVIPAAGGEPRRLSWHPDRELVVGWTPDGTRVLFSAAGEYPGGTELFSVPAAGGDRAKLPLGWASYLDIDAESGRWAFNRRRPTMTWKRYRGGGAPEIWVGHPERADYRRITEFDGPDAYPMWHQGRIYFLSDQGGTGNLWSMEPDGSDRRRHTDFDDWDARWPAMSSDGRIVFVLAADLHLFDPADGSVRALEVELGSDRTLTRRRYPNPGRYLSSFDLSPQGDRLAIVTRGEIFSVPVEEGVTLPVTRQSGARERDASFIADGERLVYITDASRDEEIRTLDAWGRGEPAVVKAAGPGRHFRPLPSPDGKWIAYADQSQTLSIVAAQAGEKPRLVDRSPWWGFRGYAWSPDGRWLAYAKGGRPPESVICTCQSYSSIALYDTREGTVHEVTGPTTEDYSPAWDPDGRYLYFLSNRSFNPFLDTIDAGAVELSNTVVMAVLLREDVKNPNVGRQGLPPEESETEEKKEKDKDDGEAGDDEAVGIDIEGLGERVVRLPIPRGRYSGLAATAKKLFFLQVPFVGMAEWGGVWEEGGANAALMSYDLETEETTEFLAGVSDFDIALAAEKIAVMRERGELYVVGAGGAAADLTDARVALADVVVELDPREEWEQIFYEGWRRERDFFWEPEMGGLDWEAIRDRYAALLPRLANRDDLRDLVWEMLRELNTSHAYTLGGDPGVELERVGTGLLGAELEREGDVYRIVRILRGDPADNVRSPLDEPGSQVAEGSYLLAVNHRPFAPGRPFEASLENLAGREVVLTVNARPVIAGAREVLVRPLPSDRALRLADWVRRNREYVAEKTGGKIGYLYLPDMMTQGMIAFNTWFYHQLHLEGMIIDARWNGGGFVSEIIIDRLRRRQIFTFNRLRTGSTYTYPGNFLNGPFVVLTNEFAGSDGDRFPAVVQQEGLAPIIGMRTWGIGIGMNIGPQLVDGGFVTVPAYARCYPGTRHLENHGVDPDIVVDTLPQELARGVDAQLDRAIAEVLKRRQEVPPVQPDYAPLRPRTREAFREELDGE